MRIFVAAAAIAAILGTSSGLAAPLEYVRVCTAFGTGWFYIPGTDTCYNASTGETKTDGPDGVITGESKMLEEARDATEGVALSLALPVATVDQGKTFGAAVNYGTFDGENAIGVGGAIVAADGLTISGAFGLGLGRGTTGGRAGVNYSW